MKRTAQAEGRDRDDSQCDSNSGIQPVGEVIADNARDMLADQLAAVLRSVGI